MEFDNIYKPNTERILSEREQEILESIVKLYILKAAPIGSRYLSKYLEEKINLSPATLRNVMSDLEEMEFISHPHTSAGRIPTDKGYRFYVNSVKQKEQIRRELNNINIDFAQTGKESKNILREANKILGAISNYLSVVRIPQLVDSVVEKIQLVSISSTRILVILAFDSNIIRTVTLEIDYEIDNKSIDILSLFINERISGRTLKFLRENFDEIVQESEFGSNPLIRLFVDSVDRIFYNETKDDKILTFGTQNLLSYPEFEDSSSIRSIIELIENEDIIVHLLDNVEETHEGIKVLIGKEMNNELLENYSLVMSTYKISGASGTIGVIGPKRMNYPKLMNIVSEVSTLISKEIS